MEALAEERGTRQPGPELLREMMLDVLGRYEARRRLSPDDPERGGGIMTPQVLTRLLENCRKLVGHARGAGRRVADALGERFGARAAAAGRCFDVYALHLAVADELAGGEHQILQDRRV